MACITKQHIGDRTYLYESESFRDINGKPRNRKRAIGKIDPATGKIIYKQAYLDRMRAAGTPVEIADTQTYISQNQLEKTYAVMDSVKDYGVAYLLNAISEQIGLTKILKTVIPSYWQEVLTLAYYMVVSDKPVMYCSDWVSTIETYDVGNMTSQRISELLAAFGADTRDSFYKAWCRHITEKEYVALDITSISSYSELITENEWGYNRDHDNLPQINLCMMLGEQSQLPIYQTVYNGSIKDVSTLKCTMAEFRSLIPESRIRIVMDKGFFSVKNINAMLDKDNGNDFLISVPFTSSFACKQVEGARKSIDQIENTVITSSTPIRGVHHLRAWSTSGEKIHTHILYNPEKEMKEKNELYGYVTDLKKKADENPTDPKLREEFDKYLLIRRSEKTASGFTITIRDDVIQKQLEHTGWLVLISNCVTEVQEAHDLYRTKDVVEKGFCRLKNSLELGRLHVQRNDRMQNKLFVGFLALILMSWLHRRMTTHGLYKQMTFDKMMMILSKIRVATISGHKILRPLSKEQKLLLAQLGVTDPVG